MKYGVLLLSGLFVCAAARSQSALEPFVSGGIFRSRPIDPVYRYTIRDGFDALYIGEGRIDNRSWDPLFEAGLLWIRPFRKFYPDLSLSAGYYSYTLRRSQQDLLRPGSPDSLMSTTVSHLRLWPGISVNGVAASKLRLHCTLGPSIWLPLHELSKPYVGAAGEVGIRYRMLMLKAGVDIGFSNAAEEDLVRSAMPAFRSGTFFAGLTVFCGRWKLPQRVHAETTK